MTVKRIALIFATLFISMICVGVMNIHYDVLSRYTYEISDEDADKLRKYLTYKEINYLIDYSIAADGFIDYIDKEGFNVYHFDFYNRINDVLGTYISKRDIVRYAEKALKDNIDEDTFINLIGMGYDLDTITKFYEDGNKLLRKDNLAIDPLNYSFTFGDNDTVYTLAPYDLVLVTDITNTNLWLLRNTVNNQLINCLMAMDKDTSYSVINAVSITRGFESYDKVTELRRNGDKTLTPGKNYYQLGRMFTLDCTARYADSFFEEFNKNCGKYGFVLTDNETHEYFYVGN